MSQPPRNRPPSRQAPGRQGGRPQGQGGPPPRDRDGDYYERPSRYPSQRNGGYYRERPRYVQPQRDPFPYLMGGIIGALVVGLALVIFLLINNNRPTIITSNPTAVPSGTQGTSGDTPPRMPLDELKGLYDDPAKRPLIIDVRATQAYSEGHILGAVSMPEQDIDVLVSTGKIPKDKLVIAYCQ
jgi:hypothetical protein